MRTVDSPTRLTQIVMVPGEYDVHWPSTAPVRHSGVGCLPAAGRESRGRRSTVSIADFRTYSGLRKHPLRMERSERAPMFKRPLAIAAAVVAMIAAACGASGSDTATPASTAPATVAPAAAVPESPPAAATVKVGNSVGDRIPEFKISLADGTAITSAALHQDDRPAFLFFFSRN